MGVLYVVDSVTRQWVEAARKAGQPSGGAAPDGTFAAGVNRVTELLPVLMTDIINNAPENQKVRSRDYADYYPTTTPFAGFHEAGDGDFKSRRSIRSRISRYIPLYTPASCIETMLFVLMSSIPSLVTNSPLTYLIVPI